MGLLDETYSKAKVLAGLLADAYQTGSSVVAPNQADVEMRPKLAKGLLEFLPGSGDAISGYDAMQSAKQGNYGEAALNGVGLLPFVPAMGGVLKGADLKSELLRQAKDGWSKAIGDSGTFTLKKMYPVTIDINGNAINFGASKASGGGPLSLTRLVDTRLGPQFVHYKLSKDGDLIPSGTQNLFAMTPDVRNEHIDYFNNMFKQ